MAGRASWKGYLKLSLVSCPVKLFPATSAGASKISFNLLHKDTLNRVQQRYHDPELGEIDRADAAPTAAQLASISAAESDSSTALKRWQDLRAQDLPALNRELKAAGLGELEPARGGRAAGEGEGDIE